MKKDETTPVNQFMQDEEALHRFVMAIERIAEIQEKNQQMVAEMLEVFKPVIEKVLQEGH